MIKDYSGSVIGVNGRSRIRPSRRRTASFSRELFSATRLMRKTIGALLLTTMVIGIGSTVWYGLRVRVALGQIGDIRSINNKLQNENKVLLVKRNIMLTQDHMQADARKLGLRAPAKDQLRYP